MAETFQFEVKKVWLTVVCSSFSAMIMCFLSRILHPGSSVIGVEGCMMVGVFVVEVGSCLSGQMVKVVN